MNAPKCQQSGCERKKDDKVSNRILMRLCKTKIILPLVLSLLPSFLWFTASGLVLNLVFC
jgi:hypothetical protein